MKQIVFISVLLGVPIMSCHSKRINSKVGKCMIPESISKHFSYYPVNTDITLGFDIPIGPGEHDDIQNPENGIIRSKKYGWSTDIQYVPILRYENDRYYLFCTGSQIDRIRLTRKVLFYWYVIRKHDGKIVRILKLPHKLYRPTIENDIMYYKKHRDDDNIYCFKIGE